MFHREHIAGYIELAAFVTHICYFNMIGKIHIAV